MNVDVTSRTLIALCLICTPFLGGADGGCSGGQVAIGGDPAAGGSGGTGAGGGSTQSGGTAGSATAGSGASGAQTGGRAGSGAGGATNECSAAEQTLRDFIAANKACSSDADCQTQAVGCGITEDDCTGAVYLNGDADLAAFEAQRAAFYQCLDVGGCSGCLRTMAPPACIGGSCLRVGSEDVCSLPFEGGPCDAAIPVYAFVDGACVQRTYGGCEGNGNRFNSLEECLGTCGDISGCPPNRVVREICVECGPAGGCARSVETCALLCQTAEECGSSGFTCYNGVCQVGPCF